jgi:hypothetical protein
MQYLLYRPLPSGPNRNACPAFPATQVFQAIPFPSRRFPLQKLYTPPVWKNRLSKRYLYMAAMN